MSKDKAEFLNQINDQSSELYISYIALCKKYGIDVINIEGESTKINVGKFIFNSSEEEWVNFSWSLLDTEHKLILVQTLQAIFYLDNILTTKDTNIRDIKLEKFFKDQLLIQGKVIFCNILTKNLYMDEAISLQRILDGKDISFFLKDSGDIYTEEIQKNIFFNGYILPNLSLCVQDVPFSVSEFTSSTEDSNRYKTDVLGSVEEITNSEI